MLSTYFYIRKQNQKNKLNATIMKTNDKVVFNLNDLSDYTGITKSYLYKLTSTAAIPHFKPNGKMVFFNKAEIDQWLQRNRVTLANEIETKAATMATLK